MVHLGLCDLGVLSGEYVFSALSARMLSVEPLDDIRRSFGKGGFDDTN
jgi:hypothetical protein